MTAEDTPRTKSGMKGIKAWREYLVSKGIPLKDQRPDPEETVEYKGFLAGFAAAHSSKIIARREGYSDGVDDTLRSHHCEGCACSPERGQAKEMTRKCDECYPPCTHSLSVHYILGDKIGCDECGTVVTDG